MGPALPRFTCGPHPHLIPSSPAPCRPSRKLRPRGGARRACVRAQGTAVGGFSPSLSFETWRRALHRPRSTGAGPRRRRGWAQLLVCMPRRCTQCLRQTPSYQCRRNTRNSAERGPLSAWPADRADGLQSQLSRLVDEKVGWKGEKCGWEMLFPFPPLVIIAISTMPPRRLLFGDILFRFRQLLLSLLTSRGLDGDPEHNSFTPLQLVICFPLVLGLTLLSLLRRTSGNFLFVCSLAYIRDLAFWCCIHHKRCRRRRRRRNQLTHYCNPEPRARPRPPRGPRRPERSWGGGNKEKQRGLRHTALAKPAPRVA